MKVLSLFDGISCGRVALERAGIQVEEYYASEIDKYATQVSEKNWPDIIRLGDITKWREWDIDWASIDLILAGSPCQGFSFAGKQLAFDDPRSALFFEFVNILNHVRRYNPDVKFLLENVKMKKCHMEVIDSLLKVKSVEINSNLLSAQNRKRLYWFDWGYEEIKDKNTKLKHIFTGGIDITERMLKKPIGTSTYRNSRKNIVTLEDKANCLTASGQNISNASCTNIKINNKYYKLTTVECERLQTLPDNYTEGVSNTQRYKSLGNGWTVDVIAHIFKGLEDA